MLLKSKLDIGCFLQIQEFIEETMRCESSIFGLKTDFKDYPDEVEPDSDEGETAVKHYREKVWKKKPFMQAELAFLKYETLGKIMTFIESQKAGSVEGENLQSFINSVISTLGKQNFQLEAQAVSHSVLARFIKQDPLFSSNE